MKRAEFERRYQVIRTVTQGAVQTHHAFASTGNVVMVHEIDPSAAQEAALLAGMIARLDDGERERILDVMEVDGTAMIVTRFLLEHETLKSWLEAAVGSDDTPEAVDAAPGTPPPAAPDDGPGEFTRMFQAQKVPPQSPSGGAEPPKADSGGGGDALGTEEGPREEAPEEGDVGEFTRMFRAVKPAASPPPEPPPAPTAEAAPEPAARRTPPPPPPEASGPGEFTRMFQAVVAQPRQSSEPNPSPSVRETPAGGPGEFTRIFGAQPPPRQTPPQEPPPPSTPSTKGGYPFGQEEEYRSRLGPTPASMPLPPPTRPLERGEVQTPNPLDLPRPPGSPPPPGEYTRIIQAVDRPTPGSAAGSESPPGAPPGYPQPPGVAPGHPGGYPPPQPGGYPSQPGIAPGPYGTPPASPPSRGPSRTLLIVGLVVIVLLVVALILFFALSAGDPATVPADAVPEIEG